MWPAAAPAALSPWPSVAPLASAAAFFAAPASSTPMGSLDSSQTTPARLKRQRDRVREVLALRRRDEPGALGHHLARVGGAADDGDAVRPEQPAQVPRWRLAVRGHEALGERDHRRARPEAATRQRGDHLVQAA